MSEAALSSEDFLLFETIRIRKFRSLLDVGPLRLNEGITVLSGENDGGKTATLDAIGFLLGNYQVDSEDFAHESEPPVEIEATLKSAQGRILTIRAVAPEARTRRLEVLDRIHTGLGASPGDLPINELRERIRALEIPSPGGNQKEPLVQAVRRWLSDRSPEEFEDRWRPATSGEEVVLPHYSRFDSVQAPSPQRFVTTHVSRELAKLVGHSEYADQFVELSNSLNADIQPSLDRLRKKIQSYCPDLEDVEVGLRLDFSKPAQDVTLRVRRQGENFDLEKSGEGRRRKIALAVHETTLASLEEQPPQFSEVFAFDEPDTHLDYSSQRALFDILERQSNLDNVQLVVATHSLNFIDKVPLQSILHFGLDDQLRTEVEVLTSQEHSDEMEFLASVCSGLGLRNSILLDERCFLIVEGETEEFALPILFKKFYDRSLISAGITLFNTHGQSGARQVAEVLVREWKRRVVLMLDADALEDTRRWILRFGPYAGNGIYLIGSKEFEDSFGDEVWLRTLEGHFAPQSDPWTIEEIAELRGGSEGFGTALRNVVSRRCRRSVGKPDLGLQLARTIDRDELPPTLVDVFRHSVELADSA